MLTAALYGLLVTAVVAVAVLIIRSRDLVSCEGCGVASFLIVVLSDAAALASGAVLAGGSYPLEEFQFRLLPTLVALLGLLALWCGLFLGDPLPTSVRHRLGAAEETRMARMAMALVVVGLTARLVAVMSEGVVSMSDYLLQMHDLEARHRRLGKAFDSGIAVCLLGLAIVTVVQRRRSWRQYAMLVALSLTAFIITPSKQGIALGILYFYLVAGVLNGDLWRRLTRAPVLAVVAAVCFANIGAKTYLRSYPSSRLLDASWSEIVETGQSALARRYSGGGLYREYSTMVQRLVDNPEHYFRGRNAQFAVVCLVPRFLWPDKPATPLLNIGWLMSVDPRFRGDEFTGYAPTLVGWGFLDYGVAGAVVYLFVGGWLLGKIRRTTLGPARTRGRIAMYLTLTVLLGFKMGETSFEGLLYALVLSLVSTALAGACVALWEFSGQRRMSSPPLATPAGRDRGAYWKVLPEPTHRRLLAIRARPHPTPAWRM